MEGQGRNVANIMAEVERQTKMMLGKIREIDCAVCIKQAHYHDLATSIIRSKEERACMNTLSTEHSQFALDSKLKEFEELGKEIKAEMRKKTEIAELLYNKLADYCEQFDDFLEADVKCVDTNTGKDFLLECLGSEETSGIIMQCQAKQMEGMCVCQGKMDSPNMIKCENERCKSRWYHLKCIGLKPSSIPKGKWTCSSCKRRERE